MQWGKRSFGTWQITKREENNETCLGRWIMETVLTGRYMHQSTDDLSRRILSCAPVLGCMDVFRKTVSGKRREIQCIIGEDVKYVVNFLYGRAVIFYPVHDWSRAPMRSAGDGRARGIGKYDRTARLVHENWTLGVASPPVTRSRDYNKREIITHLEHFVKDKKNILWEFHFLD